MCLLNLRRTLFVLFLVAFFVILCNITFSFKNKTNNNSTVVLENICYLATCQFKYARNSPYTWITINISFQEKKTKTKIDEYEGREERDVGRREIYSMRIF